MEAHKREWLMLIGAVLMTALFVHAARAAPPCYPGESASQNFAIEIAPQDIGMWAEAPDAGFTALWFCDAKYQWTGHAWVGLKRNLVQNFLAEMGRLTIATHAEKDAAWGQYITFSCDAPPPEHAALCAELPRKFALARPAPIIWLVRDNPTATSRPVFGLNSDGSRNVTAIAGQRVSDVNTECGCATKAIEEATNTYCSVSGRPNVSTPDPLDTLPLNRVALCVRTN